jgi:hypothetical protein
MSEYKAKRLEIENSNLPIALDLSPFSVLYIIDHLVRTEGHDGSQISPGQFYPLLWDLMSALEFEFPGSHHILFPDAQLVNRKYEEL